MLAIHTHGVSRQRGKGDDNVTSLRTLGVRADCRRYTFFIYRFLIADFSGRRQVS
jgi:hypothetical protein